MKYERIERNVTYNALSCKMYLRHDFKHKCAYCGVSEDIISGAPNVAESFFEKDHFLPQNSKAPDVHEYYNLFYACKKCNGVKNNILLPLNPCNDTIFEGESANIIGGTAETDYVVYSTNDLGKDYIDKLQLNSRHHIELRQYQDKKISDSEEVEKIINDIKHNGKLTTDQIDAIISAFRDSENVNSARYLCGSSLYGRAFEEAIELLKSQGYSCKILFGANELDIEIIVDDVKYFAQLRITKNIQNCRLATSVLEKWKAHGSPCGVVQYITSSRQIRFSAVDFNRINWSGNTHLVSNYIDL